MAASRLGSDDGHSSTINDRSPSPLSTSQGSSDAQFSNSYFAPVSRLGSIDSDVHMTDATDGTADTRSAAIRERFSSPRSTSTATTNGRKKIGRGGATASVAMRGSGGGSGSKASSSWGGSNRSAPATRGGSGAARSKPKSASNSHGGRLAHSYARSSTASSIKRELDTDADSEDGDDSDDESVVKRRRNNGHRNAMSDDDDDDDADNGSMDGTGNGYSAGREDDANTSDPGVYCLCRGPDDHRWMIQCEECDDWYHGDCINIKKEDGETLILSYICPHCTIPGRYTTRFKKRCSLPGCRAPARLYGDDGTAAVLTEHSSHFCSDVHRDKWWDALLGRLGRVRSVPAATEAKLAVDQFTPAQLMAVLAHTNQPGVVQMLLHGLADDADGNSAASLDAVLTKEERATTQASAADRGRFAAQIEMCKKMLQLLDMVKARHQDAVKAGHIERDACGYDARLRHVGVQPHFEHFLASPEGTAIYRSEALLAPQFDDSGNPVDGRAGGRDESGDDDGPEVLAARAGMCGKRKCKAHSSWFSTLARDVRLQIQELTRQIAMLLDNEGRIRLAAIQRSFIMEHSSSQVRFVDDTSNSLGSLASDPKGDDEDAEEDASTRDSRICSLAYNDCSKTLRNGSNGSNGVNGNAGDDSRDVSRSPNGYHTTQPMDV